MAPLVVDEPVAWLHHNHDPEQPSTPVELGFINLLHVMVQHSSDKDEPPTKKQRLAGQAESMTYSQSSSSPQQNHRLLVLASSTIRVSTSIPPTSSFWTAVQFVLNQPLPIALTEPRSQPDPSQHDRFAVELDIYDLCNGNSKIASLQIHNVTESLLSQLQMMCKAQLPWKAIAQPNNSYQRYKNSFMHMAAVPKIFIRRSSNAEELLLDLILTWRDGMSCLGVPKIALKRSIDVFQALSAPSLTAWRPQDFYESVYTPPSDQDYFGSIHDDKLSCDLYPFQRRTLQFMLAREGVQVCDGQIAPLTAEKPKMTDLPTSFVQYKQPLESGYFTPEQCIISPTFGKICSLDNVQRTVEPPRGGILAEEMGLGKTVELIALIATHTRKLSEADKKATPDVDKRTLPSKATLIITPPHLMQQWEDELKLHAPSLNVHVYKGVSAKETSTRTELANFHVVLTTYAVIGREIWYADAQPKKNLRHARKYVAPTSPLVEIEWWRVCLDEAQMIENALTNAAVVARLIPRINAWAVSGTPFKNHVTDLFGLLTFLQYAPFSDRKIWNRVDKLTFKQIFRTIAIRHTKDKVTHELQLPVQRRYVMTIPFLAVEEQHYAQVFQEMCTDCGFNQDGSPTEGDHDVYAQSRIEKMRTWLRRLRQLCLHPQVGGRNRRALGTGKDMPLRTVEEVLRVMIDQNDNLLRGAERAIVGARIQIGHLHAFDGSREDRSIQSLSFYQSALDLITPMVAECRAAFNSILPVGQSRKLDIDEDRNEISDKTREQQQKTSNLRKALELQHACEFFVGTAYYQWKENETLTTKDSTEYKRLEALEVMHYDTAKVIRLEILKDSREKAENYMKQVGAIQELTVPAFVMPDHSGGIENVKIMDKLQDTCNKLKQQTSLIVEWRNQIHKILLKPLVDNDEQTEQTGEEYGDSTKEQDELYVLFLVLRTIAAYRSTFITGYVNPLIEHEAIQAWKQAKNPDTEDKGPAPELMIECLVRLQELRPGAGVLTMRGAVVELRALFTQLEWQYGEAESNVAKTRIVSEMSIVREHMKYIQKAGLLQGEAVSELEKEIDQFRVCMNHRLAFYKDLQRLSDMVQPLHISLSETFDELTLKMYTTEENKQTKALASYKTKQRFLEHLREESEEESQRMCVICQSGFENGVLTICGHQYCKFCIQEWWSQHRSCPLCKRHLELEHFHDITYKPRELKATQEVSLVDQKEASPNANVPQPTVETSLYSAISTESLNQIKAIDLPTSFGTKIDTIARHLIWLRTSDPGAKSIIFSQFTDFLEVLAVAMNRCYISHCSILNHKEQIERFRHDPNIECFLLDAKSDCSGLNLTGATHVFLCEPLVNPAIELQAVARVHRIGQRRATTVWMTLIADSVEEAVYNLSIGRRLEHVAQQIRDSEERQTNNSALAQQQQNDQAIVAANSAELQSVPVARLLVKGIKSGELVAQNDVWTCLFSQNKTGTRVNDSLRTEMDRHFRVDAAERRRDDASNVMDLSGT